MVNDNKDKDLQEVNQANNTFDKAGKTSNQATNNKESSNRSDTHSSAKKQTIIKKQSSSTSKTNVSSNQKQSNQQKDLEKNSKQNDTLVSVVVPLLNEEESLPELVLHLEQVLGKIAGKRYEIIFIDDGSTDNSFAVIKQIRARNQRVRAFRFRRNYGKSAALSVGFQNAKGRIVITMDADLQDDPDEIPNLINKIREGYDLVSGWKKKRYDPITKTIPSKFFNFVTSVFSGVKLHDFNCGLKAYRQELVKDLQVYGEMHRYIPALAHWEGYKVTEIPVQHHPRKYGKTKFGISRFLKGFLDLLTVMFTTRFLKRPLHFFGTLGGIFAFAGFVIDLYLLIDWIIGKTYLSNRPLALFGIALIIVGVQLISLGLLGELIAKNMFEKVNYKIKEKL
ncbi:MAG: glycosyltransferase [Candidatus Kapabacteria bacterium]|nr:glycosyltransferase [Candidatus Kapabacteria bacterium]